MEWHEAINQLEPYIVRISTPDGFGTGFILSRIKTSPLCALVTAAHVVDHAHYWEEPIRLYHPQSGKTLLLRSSDRAINLNPTSDTASLIFEHGDLPFPPDALPLIDKGMYLKPGVEIGWIGFPAIPRAELCFFSGRISAYLKTIRHTLSMALQLTESVEAQRSVLWSVRRSLQASCQHTYQTGPLELCSPALP